MIYCFFLLLFFSFLNFCIFDYFIWWSVFVICTFVFVLLVKDCDINCLISYYVLPEVCGYYFLVFNNWKMQFLLLMLKSGSAPFHFWIFSVLEGLKKWYVLWFLTLQKLPYFFVLVNFWGDFFFIILFIGMVLCYIQVFLLRSFFDMLVVVSTESFNWLLLLSIFSFSDVFFFVFFYYFIMFLVLSYIYSSVNFFSVEMVLLFFNVPLSLTFFLKILLIFGSGIFVGYFYLFLLFIMPIMSLGISYFFFCISMSNFNVGVKYYDYLVYVLFCFGLLVYF
uniref:NADH dehydrogenase subunit 2 n=1 Tax=Setaria labiatopapillosa TaxID=108094 RepID=A0A4Y6I4I7_9BILA|nr:NADH dehydrogenase subunit 2 [Setaria labiatopapillosa]QDF64271.1 NADH dehydrogenase subunit 2 [Setaria labiatopapillosa]